MQWNDFKIFFGLFSSFQNTKILLGKIMAALEPSWILNHANHSFL